MAESATDERPLGVVGSIWPALLLVAGSAGMVLWSFQYGETARMLPVLIAGVTLVFSVLDLLSRFDGALGRGVRFALGASFRDREMKHDPSWRAELAQFGWVVGCLAAVIVIGILPAMPLFVLAYMYFQGGQSLRFSLLVAAAVLVVLGVTFELLLGYELYRGMIIDPHGFG